MLISPSNNNINILLLLTNAFVSSKQFSIFFSRTSVVVPDNTVSFLPTVLAVQLVQGVHHDDLANGSGWLSGACFGFRVRRLARQAFLSPKAPDHRRLYRDSLPERWCGLYPSEAVPPQS